jgi:hypothetical protein
LPKARSIKIALVSLRRGCESGPSEVLQQTAAAILFSRAGKWTSSAELLSGLDSQEGAERTGDDSASEAIWQNLMNT